MSTSKRDVGGLIRNFGIKTSAFNHGTKKLGKDGLGIALCVTILQFLLCLQVNVKAYGIPYVVGGADGWTFLNKSTGVPVDYSLWASRYTFMVNDILIFNYQTNAQNLYSFDSYEAWKTCNFSSTQLLDDGSSGSSQWYLPYEGYYSFASGTYCTRGQKFRIYAMNSSDAGDTSGGGQDTSPTPSSSQEGLPPPPPSLTGQVLTPYSAPLAPPSPSMYDIPPAGPVSFPYTPDNNSGSPIPNELPVPSPPDYTVAAIPPADFFLSMGTGMIIGRPEFAALGAMGIMTSIGLSLLK